MKLFVASLVVLASSVATVSAVDDTSSPVNACIWEQTDEDELEFYDMLINTSTTWEDIEAMGIALHGMYEGITCDQLSSGLCGHCPLMLDDCALENASDECDAHLEYNDITIAFTGGKCKYSCPKNHCKISTKFNKDTASSSWDSTNKAADDIRRNLRTNRVLSGPPDVEIDENGPCSTKSCDELCPLSITTTIDDVEHMYLLDEDACVEGSDEGECTYTHKDYENDTDEDEHDKEFCVVTYDLDGNVVEYKKESLSTDEQAACVDPLCKLKAPDACSCTIDGPDGPDIGLCGAGKICTGKSDKEEYECVDPTDPEEEKKETIYCIKDPDGIFHEGGANVLQYMFVTYPDKIKQRDKKNGLCMKFANASCKKPETLELTGNDALNHDTYICVNPADDPAP